MMLSNLFAKHLFEASPPFVVEKGISHSRVVCFSAIILTHVKIAYLVFTCSGQLLKLDPKNHLRKSF